MINLRVTYNKLSPHRKSNLIKRTNELRSCILMNIYIFMYYNVLVALRFKTGKLHWDGNETRETAEN